MHDCVYSTSVEGHSTKSLRTRFQVDVSLLKSWDFLRGLFFIRELVTFTKFTRSCAVPRASEAGLVRADPSRG